MVKIVIGDILEVYSERPLLDAELLAIEEINDAGGIIGRRIDPKIADGFPSDLCGKGTRAGLLLHTFRFRMLTSASRKPVRAVVEASNALLWYPVQYEGLEESPTIIYTGSCLNQQIVPALQWIFANRVERISPPSSVR